MSSQTPPAPQNAPSPQRVGSFIGWAFLISIVLHAITLPFVHLNEAAQSKEKDEKVAIVRKIKVTPPTPPPKRTPPPVKQTAPPPVKKLVVNPPKQTSKSVSGPSEQKYVPPPKGDENGVPQGNAATGAPAKVESTAPPGPTTAPTVPPTPKAACAVPNKEAAIKGEAVAPEYPDSAREQGAIGTARVAVTLDATGAVKSVSIDKSAGNAALDAAAKAAAQATSYTAEIVNCVPTAGTYSFEADFTGQ